MKLWIFAAAAAFVLAAGAADPEWIGGKVVKVDAERSRVTLDHERIRSIDMDAMTMPFKVDKRVDLRRFKPGDRVRFTIRNQDDHLVVEAMEVAR